MAETHVTTVAIQVAATAAAVDCCPDSADSVAELADVTLAAITAPELVLVADAMVALLPTLATTAATADVALLVVATSSADSVAVSVAVDAAALAATADAIRALLLVLVADATAALPSVLAVDATVVQLPRMAATLVLPLAVVAELA